jgi:hypothetical protein
MRALASNDFKKDLYNLLNNAEFEKKHAKPTFTKGCSDCTL